MRGRVREREDTGTGRSFQLLGRVFFVSASRGEKKTQYREMDTLYTYVPAQHDSFLNVSCVPLYFVSQFSKVVVQTIMG